MHKGLDQLSVHKGLAVSWMARRVWNRMISMNDENHKPGGMRLPEGYKIHPVTDGGVGGPKRNDLEDSNGRRKKASGGENVRRRLDEAVRGRIDGLGVEELELILRFFPGRVLWMYVRLLDLAFGERNLGSGRGYDENDLGLGARSPERLSSAALDYRGSAVQPRQGTSRPLLRSEVAVQYRSKLDRKLRRIGREIESFLTEKEFGRKVSVVRQCSGKCKKFGDADWNYCPNCGGPMQETV